MIVVTGATGTVGSEVVQQLIEARRPVRALVRDRAKARWGEAVEVAVGDLGKPETLRSAFAGAESVFVLTASLDMVTLEANAYAAAQQAGARHIVKLSAARIDAPFMAAAPFARWHGESEARLRASGLAWTILRPTAFAANALRWRLNEQHTLHLPTGEGKDALIDPRDIAAVAVRALTTRGYEGKIYELTGPELLSYAEVVQKVAGVLRRSLTFTDVPEATVRAGMLQAGMPEQVVESLLTYYAGVKAGDIAVTSTVTEILGRPARTFDEWLRDHAAALR